MAGNNFGRSFGWFVRGYFSIRGLHIYAAGWQIGDCSRQSITEFPGRGVILDGYRSSIFNSLCAPRQRKLTSASRKISANG
jgi:hypothetical protein